MGTTAPALVIAAVAAAVAAAAAPHARADGCTGTTRRGSRFATCFDLGNRLSITAGSEGFGGAIAVRHLIRFDDEPDLVWKMEHLVGESTHAAWQDRFAGALYRGRFVRHARDGHIVIPLGTPKKLFLPFDVGAEVTAGSLAWRPGSLVRAGVVKTQAVVDFARTRTFHRRLAFGPIARWDIDLDRERKLPTAHLVAPFSVAGANLRLESATGRTVGDLRVEAGRVWHSDTGWQPAARAEASLERIVVAINDRPIALTLGVEYASATDEALARVGARIVLFDRRDSRVRLR